MINFCTGECENYNLKRNKGDSIMNIILRSLRLLFELIGFLVISFALLLLVARATHTPGNINIFIDCTGAFIKKILKDDQFIYKNEPSKISKFLTHIKLLGKETLYSNRNQEYSENFWGMNLSFPGYSMVHMLINEIFIHKIYAFKSKKIEPFIIDAGSNIGMSILFFKKMYPGATVIGFEPSRRSFYFLEKNVKNNNLNKVQIINKALSVKQDQELKLYHPGTVHGTLRESEKTEDYEIAQTALLSNYINQPVDFLKMDIEGAEYKVLQELFDTDRLKFVDQMVIEYHAPQNHISKLFDILDKSNFNYEINDGYIYAYKQS